MQNYTYTINKNEAVNRWLLSDVKRKNFESPHCAFNADINLGEGYVQIVYPVREAFLKKEFIKDVALSQMEDVKHVYFPFENNRVEFTTFIHTPHYLSFWGETCLEVEESCDIEFEVYTCGGIKLWLNEEEVLCFDPYTRNIGSKTRLTLHLEKGLNKLQVFADELAERDVFFYFELRNVSNYTLVGTVPVQMDPLKLKKREKLMQSIHVIKDTYIDGDIEMGYDQELLDEDITLKCTLPMRETNEPFDVLLSNSNDKVVLANAKDAKVGYFDFNLLTQIGPYSISRNLVVANCYDPYEDISFDTIEERKDFAIKHTAKLGQEKIPTVMAILETEGKLTDVALRALRANIEKIRRKEDCADFQLGSLMMLLTKYDEYLTEELKVEIKEVILDFRYWIDEPGNDVMWYFSENHALLFHAGQYVAGHLYPDETFTASKRLGKEQKAIGRERLLEWFDLFEKYGLGEWNSLTYIPVDLIAFFNLYALAPDEDIRQMAKEALDDVFEIMALHNFNGIFNSTYGRVYEHSLKGRELTGPTFIEWVTKGKGRINSHAEATVLYALSDYVPRDYYEDYTLNDEEAMTISMIQGANENHLKTYVTNHYSLSCIEGFNPFVHGHQQHIMNIGLGHKGVQFHINHPGERVPSGGGRPSYWAGNGTNPLVRQFKNVQLMLFDINPEELVHYIHGYLMTDRYDAIIMKDRAIYMQSGEGFVGIRCSNEINLTKHGANTNKEFISEGLHHGLYIKCGSTAEWDSFQAFIDSMENAAFAYDKQSLNVYDQQYGEMVLSGHDQVFKVNGNIHLLENNGKVYVKREAITRW